VQAKNNTNKCRAKGKLLRARTRKISQAKGHNSKNGCQSNMQKAKYKKKGGKNKGRLRNEEEQSRLESRAKLA